MAFTLSRILVALALLNGILVTVVEGSRALCFQCNCPHCNAGSKKMKRFGDGLDIVEKRQQDPSATVWPLSPLPDWAAIGYFPCGKPNAAGTTTICPTDYYCACQTSGSSLCLPTSTGPTPSPTGCSIYTGKGKDTDCEHYWATTLTQMASAYGQCDGFLSKDLDLGWNTMTLCPTGYSCSINDFWYGQCLPTTLPQTATGYPPPLKYWGCDPSVTFSSPTAGGDMCGGHCFTASGVNGNCPTIGTTTYSCYTQTARSPGFAAVCAVSSPTGALDASTDRWQATPAPLCYSIPFFYDGSTAPLCNGYTPPATPTTSSPSGPLQSHYSQCGGSSAGANGGYYSYNGPSNCGCGWYCSTQKAYNGGNDGYANCNPIPGFNQQSCLGAGTQTMYGQCGGKNWTGLSQCPTGAHCITDDSGWYAGCTPPNKLRHRRTPAANPASQATPASWYNGHYAPAAVAAQPTL